MGTGCVAWKSEPCANTSQQGQRPGGSERKITVARMVACLFLACSHRMIGNEGSSLLSDLSHVISASGRVK
jgi:hypothetical protein